MEQKITRSQIKSIVKECLREILQEGLGVNSQPLASGPTYPSQQQRAIPRPRSASLDTPLARQGSQQASLKNVIKAESRGNPVMEDIFADTARRTLPGMLNESSSGRVAQQEQFRGDPSEVFGDEVASKWALLAFSEPKNKNMT